MESDCPFYTYAAAAADVDGGHGRFVQQLSGEPAGNGGERKRRFTEEQVRSLESTFHSRRAAKLEPREKAELARELGLQPRQVAIWFQNKRARWRSKQLETDFAELRAGYDDLHARVESLRQEKLTLAAQLEELKEKLNERQDQSASSTAEVDDKRHDASYLADSAAAVADVVREDSAAGRYEYDDHHLAYEGGLPEPFCASPELWETTTWPLVEWNAVA